MSEPDQPTKDAEAIAALAAYWSGEHNGDIPQMRRAIAAVDAHRKAVTDAMPWPDTYPMPAHGWTCFHCGETFTTPGSARDHFGCAPCADPACRIKVGEERGLVRALRRVEEELARRAQPASGLADDARKIVEALVFIKARTNGIAERTQEFGSHDNACAAVKLAAATLPLAESLAGKIEDLERERGRLRDVIERDRTKTAEVISTARGVLASRAWLAEGRGSYEFDDEKYQEEFGAAITEILVALDPLRALAADWSDCPKDYRGARIDWKARAEAAEAQLSALKAENADLKTTVIAFCAPWAVEYAKDHGLDGLHPTHYDILEKCGARMVDFDRASLVVPSVGKTP